MTTVAFRAGILATDSLVQDSRGNIHPSKIDKVKVVGQGGARALVSFTGSLYHQQSFFRWTETIKNWNDFGQSPDIKDNFGIVIIQAAVGWRAFEFTDDLWAESDIALDGYLSWGSGRETANGALWTGCNAEDAVEAACFHDTYSALPIQIVKFDGVPQ